VRNERWEEREQGGIMRRSCGGFYVVSCTYRIGRFGIIVYLSSGEDMPKTQAQAQQQPSTNFSRCNIRPANPQLHK